MRVEVEVGSPLLTRLGLISLALGLQTLVLYSPGHFRPATNSFFALFVTCSTVGSLALAFLATLRVRTVFSLRIRQYLGACGLLVLALLSMFGGWRAVTGMPAMMGGVPYNNDGAVMDLYAAGQARHGHNPYARTNIVKALAAMNAPAITTTPLMDGQFRGLRAYPSEAAVQQAFLNVQRLRPRTIPPEFESKYNYPAGSFLFILPFVWAGVNNMRFLYALAFIAMGVYIASRMPRSLRILVPLLLLANVPIINLTVGGQPDPLYGLFLMLGYSEWRSSRVSATFMGLAVGTKQLAWFFLPFYIALTVRNYGVREAVRRMGFITGIFLLMNAPFIWQSPHAYFSSIVGPASDPMFPLGIGVIALFVAKVLPMAPKLAFTIAEAVSWIGGLTVFIRLRWLAPASGVVFAALPLFFAWRSLVNYFYLVPLLVVAVMLAETSHVDHSPGKQVNEGIAHPAV
ncbi:MAG: hypothetical protein NVSMB52_08170 [Chloroflexota bacterium]